MLPRQLGRTSFHTLNVVYGLPRMLRYIATDCLVTSLTSSLFGKWSVRPHRWAQTTLRPTKDKLVHAKINRKEAKESAFFLRMIRETNSPQFSDEETELINESNALEIWSQLGALRTLSHRRRTQREWIHSLDIRSLRSGKRTSP